ncbi:Crp/Fnr family transcriptional regulator [Chitinophaga sp. XS-30]|uniref:Crp/Fnr family transcriptional regulator n=1 Tax=Chitinophaga sp. XS-30 TaxID=2604421 RepID=UPI0011DD580A|nr:Crp/Fnr family transcriptional regulator [Chitinophaga sp. XS-30]QEH40128.1 Crp/Fnr family transcriptional regulator [Chitinophaga sp. XS-30]
MFESLAKYLVEKGSLTGDELRLVEEVTIPKKIRKHQYLLQEGDVSHFQSFVAKGCLRLYRVGEDGRDHIMRFAIENWWINDYSSYQSGQPSRYNIDALENSELLMIEKGKFNYLVETIPNFKNLIEQLTANNYEAHQNRIFSNISDTAEEKYDNFLRTYSTIYDRVPLHMIASFLGLSRETLSRVRQQHARKRRNDP